jgi:hypothetical protein
VADALCLLVRRRHRPETYAKAKEAGRIREIPPNHNPAFAPVLHPTLETVVAAMVVASHAWIAT